jgi:hypothetical protein
MPWNIFNTLKTPAKKAGGEILTFDSMTGVTLHTGTPGWKVYTIRSSSAITRTITANVLTDTSINIVVCGGGGSNVPGTNDTCGGGGGGRFREVQKRILASNPGQTFTCNISATNLRSVGGTSSITFSDPTVGDISCGGGGKGTFNGGNQSNAPTNGGSGGGAGATKENAYSGGTGVTNGGNGTSGLYADAGSFPGGGGGAGGNGGNGSHYGPGVKGPGVSTNLDGIKLVYTSSYKFCAGGGGTGYGGVVNDIGTGANSIIPFASGESAGAPGAIIIAIPA